MSSMRVVVITGCSSGIGLAAAVAFARNGDRVIATMRRPDNGAGLGDALAASGLAADIRGLDVANDDSVAVAVAAILADYGHVDIVVSNAGIGCDGTTEELTVHDFRALFETNTLGAVRLLHAVLPSWRARGAGRFISVGSMAGVVGQPFHDAYCASKFAVEGMLESLQPVVAQFGISVSIVEPGPVVGTFSEKLAEPPSRAIDGAYAAQRARFRAFQVEADSGAQSAAEVANVLVQVAASERPLLRYQTSDMVQRLIGRKIKDMTGERVTDLTTRWV
jgi:NAD(P)-dependent dehydrogenase (short-subunit alcohol dehydrogenase family)